MTDKRPLFRPEAVEHHARARTTHRTLDLKERRTTWLFRGLLVAVATVLGLAFVVPAESTAHGTAVVDGSGTNAVITLGDVRRVEAGQRVTLDLANARAVTGRVTGLGAPVPGAAIVVRVSLDSPAPPNSAGDAAITLGRTSVAKMLLGKH